MDSNSAQNIFKYAAVVPAAGLSSRMGAFKPLLDLGGKPLICRTLDSLRAGGCGKIFIVTGHRADELEAAAAAPDVRFVRNPAYASTGMLESVQKGLFELLREDPPDFVILLPGDVPLVNSDTMHALKDAAPIPYRCRACRRPETLYAPYRRRLSPARRQRPAP